MKKKIAKAYRWVVNRLPEALLLFFLLSLAPFAHLLALALAERWRVMSADPGSYFRSVKANPWPLLAALVCLAGCALVAFLIWRWHSLIWAVARKMIIEAMHRRAVVVLLLFFLVLTPSLPFILKTEGNLKSQVQITLTYALTLAKVLLSLLAIFVATASICSEIERQEVHITDSKPLRRWQFLAGKLLGILIMCSVLLFVMAGVSYGLVAYVSREPDCSRLTEWEAQQKKEQRQKVLDEVFIARNSVKPALPDVSEDVEKEMKRLKETGDLDEIGSPEEVRQELTERFRQRRWAVVPFASVGWELSGLKPAGEVGKEWIYVRFKLVAPGVQPGSVVAGEWNAWKREAGELSQQAEKNKPRPIQVYVHPGSRWKAGSYQEVKFPADAVGADGILHLVYRNQERYVSAIFPLEDGLEVLQEADSFLPNYYRSLMVIMFHIALLAALGLMAGAVLSFPVASLLVVFIFGLGVTGPWFLSLMESVSAQFSIGGSQELGDLLERALDAPLRLIFTVVPHFGKYSPLDDLVSGRLVSWPFVAQVGAVMVFIKGGIATLIGVFFYGRRELARVIA